MFQLTGDRVQDSREALAHYYAVKARYRREPDDERSDLQRLEGEIEVGQGDVEMHFLEMAYPEADRLSDQDFAAVRDDFDGEVQFLAEKALENDPVGKESLV